VMTRDVITVTEDMALEEAGRIMADNKITALPVMRGADLVGIITEFHLFDTLLDLFGARQSGVRITATVPGVKGTLAKITSAVSALGGMFVAIGSVEESDPQRFVVTMKVQDVDRDALLEAVSPLVTEITDVRAP
jgi:acetoin utilization protein AcuB